MSEEEKITIELKDPLPEMPEKKRRGRKPVAEEDKKKVDWKSYKRKDPEKYKAYQREYQKEYSKKYYQRNRERELAKAKEYNRLHPEKAKQRYQKYKELVEMGKKYKELREQILS